MRYKVFYEFYITLVKIFDNQLKHSLVAKGISLAIMQHVCSRSNSTYSFDKNCAKSVIAVKNYDPREFYALLEI